MVKPQTVDSLALRQVGIVGTSEKTISISPNNALDVAINRALAHNRKGTQLTRECMVNMVFLPIVHIEIKTLHVWVMDLRG